MPKPKEEPTNLIDRLDPPDATIAIRIRRTKNAYSGTAMVIRGTTVFQTAVTRGASSRKAALDALMLELTEM